MIVVCTYLCFFSFQFREERVLSQLDHDHIVKFYGRVNKPDDKKNRHIWLVMELCHNDLEDLIKTGREFSETEVSHFVLQLTLAIEHMHAKGITHRSEKNIATATPPSEFFVHEPRNISGI